MSKDPAVLFYTSDFLTGTMTMSDDHVGKYIRLLCLQHQKGMLTEQDMLYICSTYVEDVYSKFIKTPEGLYYNERMQVERDKRLAYSQSRRKNVNKRYESGSTYVVHMENENENTNDNINKDNTSKNHSTLNTASYTTQQQGKIAPTPDNQMAVRILKHWNAQDITIKEPENGVDIYPKIRNALRKYSEEEIKEAIDIYCRIFKDPRTWLDYRWVLKDFLIKDCGLIRFVKKSFSYKDFLKRQ